MPSIFKELQRPMQLEGSLQGEWLRDEAKKVTRSIEGLRAVTD